MAYKPDSQKPIGPVVEGYCTYPTSPERGDDDVLAWKSGAARLHRIHDGGVGPGLCSDRASRCRDAGIHDHSEGSAQAVAFRLQDPRERK